MSHAAGAPATRYQTTRAPARSALSVQGGRTYPTKEQLTAMARIATAAVLPHSDGRTPIRRQEQSPLLGRLCVAEMGRRAYKYPSSLYFSRILFRGATCPVNGPSRR